MKAAAIVPAYNEERRIKLVLNTLAQSPSIGDIIVVSDGSTDGTYEAAAGHNGAKAIKLPQNVGKGGAMVAGAKCTDADVIAFFDADLVGLTPLHVEALVQPVLDGRSDMSIGVFKQGRRCTDWAQKIAPYISGQRAIRREDFLSAPGLEGTRYGVEVSLCRYARSRGLNTVMVPLPGVTHPMKEEKLGLLRGVIARWKMYWDILKLVVRTPGANGLNIVKPTRQASATGARSDDLLSR